MPTTHLGSWSVALIAAFAALVGALFVAVGAGERGGDAFFDNLWLALPGLGAAAAGIAAAGVGAWAILGGHDRGWLVFVATGLGLLVTAFVAGEILLPH